MSERDKLVGLRVNGFEIKRRIGGGNWGEVYVGNAPNGHKVAFKIEKKDSRCPQLRHEFKVYRELVDCKGFCSIYWFTSSSVEGYTVLVMSLLGPSLDELFLRCRRSFSLKTTLQIADQVLERIEAFESRYLIHRDIKPSNFCIGYNLLKNFIFMVDFGMSKRYCYPKDNFAHISYSEGRSLTGTPRYASINNHLGITPSRRDDLEAVAYMLIYFMKGRLPWQGLETGEVQEGERKYWRILEKKQQTPIEQLCSGLPSQFGEYLQYTRNLKFEEAPDIAYCRRLFKELYIAEKLGSRGKHWDWDPDEDEDYEESDDFDEDDYYEEDGEDDNDMKPDPTQRPSVMDRDGEGDDM